MYNFCNISNKEWFFMHGTLLQQATKLFRQVLEEKKSPDYKLEAIEQQFHSSWKQINILE